MAIGVLLASGLGDRGLADEAGPALAPPTMVAAELPVSPMTPERAALVRRYLTQTRLRETLTGLMAVAETQAKGQFDANAGRLPSEKRDVAAAAFTKAFERTAAEEVDAAFDRMATYYGSRLTPADLTDIVTYGDSDLGRRSSSQPQTLTREDREQRGRYFAEHPAFIKLMQVSVAFSMEEADRRAGQAAEFKARFQRYYCENLAKAHINSSLCVTARH